MGSDTCAESILCRRFFIPAEEVKQLLAQHGVNSEAELHAFLLELVEPASVLARPPISRFHVGAVGLGTSGAIYVGVNMEFHGAHLNNSVHAEQCLLLNCLQHCEEGIRVIAVSEAPCGHCRQFCAELSSSDTMRFVFGAGVHWHRSHPGSSGGQDAHANGRPPKAPRPTAAYSLDQLLPAKFGPSDLMSDGQSFPLLLQPQSNPVHITQEAWAGLPSPGQAAARLAEAWAQKSYSPYTRSFSGAALVVRGGRVYGGGYVESAAYNPSLSPFHAAWVAAVTDGVAGLSEVEQVVLAELPDAPVQHAAGLRALLGAACPDATLTCVPLQRRVA